MLYSKLLTVLLLCRSVPVLSDSGALHGVGDVIGDLIFDDLLFGSGLLRLKQSPAISSSSLTSNQ